MVIGGLEGMTRQEFSKKTGVSIRNLQYYEEPLGLIHPHRVERQSGNKKYAVRIYTDADLYRIRMIKMYMELLGITPTELSDIFRSDKFRATSVDDISDEAIVADLRERLEERAKQINENLEILKYSDMAGIRMATALYSYMGRDQLYEGINAQFNKDIIGWIYDEKNKKRFGKNIELCLSALQDQVVPRDEISYNSHTAIIRSESIEKGILPFIKQVQKAYKFKTLFDAKVFIFVLCLVMCLTDDAMDGFDADTRNSIDITGIVLLYSIIDFIHQYYIHKVYPIVSTMPEHDRLAYEKELTEETSEYIRTNYSELLKKVVDDETDLNDLLDYCNETECLIYEMFYACIKEYEDDVIWLTRTTLELYYWLLDKEFDVDELMIKIVREGTIEKHVFKLMK